MWPIRSRGCSQLEFLRVLQRGVGPHGGDLPPGDEDQAEIVVHEDDLLDGIAFAGPVLLGQADGFARAAPQDSAVFQHDFRCRRGRGKQNHKTADDAGRRPPPTVPMNASCPCLARFPASLASSFIVLDRHGMSS